MNLLDEANNIMEAEKRQQQQSKPSMTAPSSTFIPQKSNLVDKTKNMFSSLMLKIKQINPVILYGVIISIIVIICIAVFVPIFLQKKSFRKVENFQMETMNGTLGVNAVVKNGVPTQVSQYGDKQIMTPFYNNNEEVQMDGQLDLNQGKIAHMLSKKNAEVNLQQLIKQTRQEGDLTSKEGYMMMQQDTKGSDWYNDNNETNITENGSMEIIKSQINDLMIQKDVNIDKNTVMNDLNLIKQNQQMRSTPFTDIHSEEQINRDSQLIQDHNFLMRGDRTTGMLLAPKDMNPNLVNKVRYLQNSGKPIIQAPTNLPTHEDIEYTNGLDLKKESSIKQAGPYVSLPSSVQQLEQDMQRTMITQEPVVDVKNQKIILDQTISQNNNGQQVLLETTVNPEIIAKVEQYEGFPLALITNDQRTAAGQFMTVLVLMKHGGYKIPQFNELVQKFPEINGMKPVGMFKKFDQNIIMWANKQINKINNNEKTLDSIIRKYQEIYGMDPKQQVQSGKVQMNGNKPEAILKETQSLQQPFGTNKESYSNQKGGKQRWVMKVERCTMVPRSRQKLNRATRSKDVVV